MNKLRVNSKRLKSHAFHRSQKTATFSQQTSQQRQDSKKKEESMSPRVEKRFKPILKKNSSYIRSLKQNLVKSNRSQSPTSVDKSRKAS